MKRGKFATVERLKFLLLILFLAVCLSSCSRSDKTSRNSETDSPKNSKEKIESEVVPQTPEEPSDKNEIKSHDAENPQTIHVFIENSGSMNGYINADSDFQMAIGRVIQLMKGYYKNIRVYYINKTAKEGIPREGEDVYKFVKKMLEKPNFTTSGTGKKDPGTASTDLNEVLTRVLNDVDESNTAILISDFVYSLPSTNGVTKSLLYDCQNQTMAAVWNKVKQLNGLLAANIIQFNSNFDGNYWSWKNPVGKQHAIKLNCPRPYYMGVFGTDANVRYFNDKISISELKGYKNEYTLSGRDVSDSKYTVIPSKYKKGISFRYDKSNAIHAIKEVKKTLDSYQLGVCIDLSSFSIPESDKTEPFNYEVYEGDYKIISVNKLDHKDLSHPEDKKVAENCTHLVILESDVKTPTDFSFGIKRTIPKWIAETSSDDDSGIKNDESEQSKTFGIKYFVDGISDAYRQYAKDKNKAHLVDWKVKIEKD